MPLFKLTNIFTVSTRPANLTTAVEHTGGFSETMWTQLDGAALEVAWNRQQTARARLLPASAFISGFRQQRFTIVGNKLVPAGTESGSQIKVGLLGALTDLPQVALQLSIQAQGNPNKSRPWIHAVPDAVMVGGEYSPDRTFALAVGVYFTTLTSVFGFIARDMSQPRQGVQSLTANVFTLDAAMPGLAVGDYIRTNRVYDDRNVPIVGSFIVTNIAGKLVTVDGLAGRTVVRASGSVRKDIPIYVLNGKIVPERAAIKKIGRPSSGYRGRRSKTRR